MNPAPPVAGPESARGPDPASARGPAAPAVSAPSWSDPTVARASDAVGGPIGRYAAVTPWISPGLVLLILTAVTLLLGMAEKSPCANARWTHNSQYTHVCYSDVIPLWDAEGLSSGAVPYRDHAVEYPVLTGGFMWLSAELTRGVGAVLDQSASHLVVVFGEVTVIMLAVCGLLVTYFTARTSRGRPWDAALFAASPLLVFHAFSNWDLLAMAFTAAALWAWSRERILLTGVLIGLGTAAKFYPMFLLVALGLLALRSGRWRPVVWAAVAAVASWVAVNGPVAAAYYSGWKEFYAYSAHRDAEASTFWAMWQYFDTGGFNKGSPGGFVPSGVGVAFVLLVALSGVSYLVLAAPRRPRVAQVVLLVVAAFLLTTKVWSPQYSLWLVPLIALARPRWRLTLLWQFSEILVWIFTLQWLNGFSDANRAIDYGWLMLILVIRDAFLLAILALVVWEMWHPEHDVVRAGGVDDPGGGIFDNAPEVFSLTAPARQERRRAVTDGYPDEFGADAAEPPER